jgi:CBS-domain-containing membrane protein
MLESVATCLQDDTVYAVARRMHAEDVDVLLVVENYQRKNLIGIITDRDIALRVVGRGLNSLKTLIQDVMTRKVVTCRPEDDVDTTLKIMLSHEIRRVPVVDEYGTIVGIIVQARSVKLRIAVRVEEDERIKVLTVKDEFHGWVDFTDRVSEALKRITTLGNLNDVLVSTRDSLELSTNQGS